MAHKKGPMGQRERVDRELTTRSFSVRAGTIDESGRSIEAVVSTETPVTVMDWQRWELIDEVLLTRGAELPDQVVLLESHSTASLDAVLGSARNLRSEGDHTVGRLVLTAGDERAERGWQKIKQGHLTDVSAGYRVLEHDDIPPNTTRRVDGKEYSAGERTLRITKRWSLREVSLVPIGADELAKVREAPPGRLGRPTGLEETRTMDFEQWLRQRGLDPATLSDERRAELQTEYDSERSAPADPPATEPAGGQRAAATEPTATPASPAGSTPANTVVDTDAIRAQAALAERARIDRMRTIVGADGTPELLQRAIDEGWDDARASREVLAAIREARTGPVSGNAPAGHSRSHETDCTAQALAAGLCHRNSIPVIDPNASDAVRRQQEQTAEAGNRYRDLPLLDVCRESIRLCGGRTPTTRTEIVRHAIELSRRAAGSTGSLSNIFSTAVNASLVQAYQEAPDTTQGWVRETDVADFKSNERTMLDKGGNLTRHARGGTANQTTRSDSKEEYKVHRFSGQFQVDEMDIIDDRFDVLRQTPAELGAAAARVRPDMVYYILLANAALGADSVALFDASDHANYGTSGTALAAPTLQAGIVAMAKQTQSSVNLNLRAQYLLVPQDLRFTAQVLLKSAERVIASSSGGTFNPLRDLNIDLRVDNRLGVAGVTDPITGTAQAGTATNWFLACSPSQGPTIEVGYLSGTGRRPELRQYVLDQGQWGIGWDIKLDLGAKALDYRGLYKATGAS